MKYIKKVEKFVCNSSGLDSITGLPCTTTTSPAGTTTTSPAGTTTTSPGGTTTTSSGGTTTTSSGGTTTTSPGGTTTTRPGGNTTTTRGNTSTTMGNTSTTMGNTSTTMGNMVPLTTYGYKISNSSNGIDKNPQTNLYQQNFDGTSNVYAPYIYHNMEPFSPLNLYEDKLAPY